MPDNFASHDTPAHNRLPRLYVTEKLHTGAQFSASLEHNNYLRNVLRLQDGASCLLFNGRDGEWRAALKSLSKKSLSFVCESQTKPQPDPSKISLAFAPLKAARLDYMVQKAVEMGACAITSVRTDYTQVSRLNEERLFANAIEAAEQCELLMLPDIGAFTGLEAWLTMRDSAKTLIFCDELAERVNPLSALNVLSRDSAVDVLVGPEGGFSPRERILLQAQPTVCTLSLGPRILRADTAAVVALTLVQAVLGDFGG